MGIKVLHLGFRSSRLFEIMSLFQIPASKAFSLNLGQWPMLKMLTKSGVLLEPYKFVVHILPSCETLTKGNSVELRLRK